MSIHNMRNKYVHFIIVFQFRLYIGKHAASEPETQAVINHVKSIANMTVMAISFHSFGQVYLTPYTFSSQKMPSKYGTHPNLRVSLPNIL